VTLDAAITIVQAMLAIAALLATIRAVRGPELADRMMALDLILLLLTGGLAAHSARDGTTSFIPVLLVVALVAFAGTTLVARFIEWRDTR
jgi:multicomponent Na+:H+ antiporter subunit F